MIAAYARLDKFRLCRAFRAVVGVPPYEYLIRLRVIRAAELLASGVSTAEIAVQVGFCDESQLSRHFRRIIGVPPGRFRRETLVR